MCQTCLDLINHLGSLLNKKISRSVVKALFFFFFGYCHILIFWFHFGTFNSHSKF